MKIDFGAPDSCASRRPQVGQTKSRFRQRRLRRFRLSGPRQTDRAAVAHFKPDFDQNDAPELVEQRPRRETGRDPLGAFLQIHPQAVAEERDQIYTTDKKAAREAMLRPADRRLASEVFRPRPSAAASFRQMFLHRLYNSRVANPPMEMLRGWMDVLPGLNAKAPTIRIRPSR